ncbi:hypothetical protein R3I94_020253 [Phoxinus phoxinus]
MVVMDEKQKERVLRDCHDSPATGGHQGITRTFNKIASAYYWQGIFPDVTKWIAHCPQCQRNATIKTVAPVLHPIKVTKAWNVIGMDLMGPFPTSPKGKKYVLTMTDLFTKWVFAKSLRCKTAVEVAKGVLRAFKLYGLVERIITDQGREFVNQLNEDIFKVLGVKQCVTSAYHPQSNGQDERTNQTIKRALSKYCNDMQNNWDESLEDVVHAINTSKQGSTKYTPFFLMFNRHPVTPEVLNSKVVSETDCFESDILNVDMDTRIAEVTALQAKVRDHIEKAQGKQKVEFESRKRKNVKSFHIHEGEEVLKANKRKEGRKGGRLEGNWTGPFLVKDITGKGVATLADKSGNILRQKTNVSQLKPYLHRDINLDDVKGNIHDDHDYCLKTDMAGGDASRTEIVQFSVDRFHILELEEEIYMKILSEETNRKRPLIQFPRCQATVEDFETLCPQKKSFPWLNDDVRISIL